MTQPKRHQKGFWSPEKNPTKICGSITQTGVVGVSPAVAIKDGMGFTAAYTGVGRYTISTVDTHFTGCLSAHACVENAANTVDMYAQIAAITCAPGAVTAIEIRTKTAANTTEVPQNDDVHFEFNLVSIGQDNA
jgi:hypothetical protein